MNYEQIEWASKHGWFFTYTTSNGTYGVIANDDYCLDGKIHRTVVEFTDFQKLKEWAGY
jgi:hypothetical protein